MFGSVRVRVAVACVAVAALLLPLGLASAASTTAFHADSPFIRDAHGRVVVLHGMNAVWKTDDYYPPSSIYSVDYVSEDKSYFDERDVQIMRERGFNVVRLGIIWKGLEPTRGTYDEKYLDRIQEIVKMLGDHGVMTLLDFHQDMYNERFDGEGFPDWATHSEVPETNCCGFPVNYFTPAVGRAFDNLWLNTDGLWPAYRAAWKHVAARFAGTENLIGYDILNEPWPGSQITTCLQPAGCPAFDLRMQQFNEYVFAGIREADPGAIVWWEPNVTTNSGVLNHVGTVTPIADGNNGLSFHAYCLIGGGAAPGVSREADPECPVSYDLTFSNQAAAGARNGSALLLSEFGASDELMDIERKAVRADGVMASWTYWQWGAWDDPTGNPAQQGMFKDDLDRDTLKIGKANVLSRTYPQAVAGTPTPWTSAPGVFKLQYRADPAIDSETYPTEIFIAPDDYSGTPTVSPTGAAEVPCPSPRLHVVCFKNTGTDVTITVSG
ncbi:MAG: cellulase family glycosylhydrolase [Actinomycetota bacterium]